MWEAWVVVLGLLAILAMAMVLAGPLAEREREYMTEQPPDRPPQGH